MADKHLSVKLKTYFSAAANRLPLNSGEEIQTTIAKIAKWLGDLKTVAFTGSYNDLIDKPTIPTIVDQTYSATSTNAQSGTAVAQALAYGKGLIGDVEFTVKERVVASQSSQSGTNGVYVVKQRNISLVDSSLVEKGGVYALVDGKFNVWRITFCTYSGWLDMHYCDTALYSSSSEHTKVGYETTYTQTLKLYRIA